ncbi:MAG: hypothetical protein V7727_02010 [Sneathiella sp.]
MTDGKSTKSALDGKNPNQPSPAPALVIKGQNPPQASAPPTQKPTQK